MLNRFQWLKQLNICQMFEKLKKMPVDVQIHPEKWTNSLSCISCIGSSVFASAIRSLLRGPGVSDLSAVEWRHLFGSSVLGLVVPINWLGMLFNLDVLGGPKDNWLEVAPWAWNPRSGTTSPIYIWCIYHRPSAWFHYPGRSSQATSHLNDHLWCLEVMSQAGSRGVSKTHRETGRVRQNRIGMTGMKSYILPSMDQWWVQEKRKPPS